MKRFARFLSIVALAAAVVTGMGVYAPAQAAGEQKFVMKLALATPAGDIRDQVCQKMAELAKEKSKGMVVVEVFPGGQLGDWRDAIEGLSMGINEIVLESIGTLDAYSDLANIDAVPYLYRDIEHFKKAWFGPIGEKILTAVGEEGNFKLIGPQNRGARIVTSKVPFKTIADLKGLKLRVPNIQVYIETWRVLGAAPTPLAFTETFTALQQNTVVAQENPIMLSYSSSFYDVCKYLIETDHVFSADIFIFNKQYFEGLPADVQKILTEACNEAAAWRNEEFSRIEADFKQKFRDQGVTIIEPDRAQFIAAFDGFVEKYFPKLVQWEKEIKALQ
ncbi:MAG: TRAP transporter substrate-binding protein [Deltaproteobacteria bacterium]|jgi:tripartite ATP-independent transporter DctP family solute receptor|nr:TRAP transporter substrate-binding protein [Deltaproteobacteria bacterium]